MSDLKDRLRKARQIEIKVGGVTFTAMRYTGEQWSQYVRDDTTTAEICRRHVIGWSGVKEKDIFGEGDKAVPFDRELFNEAIADRLDWAKAIIVEMGNQYVDYNDRCVKEVKK